MKYDFLIMSSLPYNTGCFLRAKYLSLALERNGARVKLLLPCRTKPFMFDFVVNFFKYLTAVLIYDFKAGIAVKPYPNTLIPLLLKKLISHNKIIVDIDDIDFGYRKGIISLISRYIQKPFPRFFNLITYHNKLLRSFIINEYKAKENILFTLKQGVDFNLFNYQTNIKRFKAFFFSKNNLKKNTKIVIYAAHLNIASDLDVILYNIKNILQKNICYLIIAGGGPLFPYFQTIAAALGLPNIYFTGYLKPEEITKYILMSDYSLVYYKDKDVNYYRSSMKIREHLALRKKIICNDVGELKLFKAYTYQSKKDIQSFLNLLHELLTRSPIDKREIKGYEFIKKNYNWDTIALNLLKRVFKHL